MELYESREGEKLNVLLVGGVSYTRMYSVNGLYCNVEVESESGQRYAAKQQGL